MLREGRLKPRWRIQGPRSWLQTQKQLHTPENLAMTPFGFCSIISTKCRGYPRGVIHTCMLSSSHTDLSTDWIMNQLQPFLAMVWELLELSLSSSVCRFWKGPEMGFQLAPATVHEHACWPRGPAGDTLICATSSPERPLYSAPALSQLYSASSQHWSQEIKKVTI